MPASTFGVVPIASALLLVAPAIAGDQIPGGPHGPHAPFPSVTVFRLVSPSAHVQEVCVAPCACAIPPISGAMRGRWTAFYQGNVGGEYHSFQVAALQWSATIGSQERTLSGLGHYKIFGTPAAQQQLTIDLSVNGGPPVRFDSGVVPWISTPDALRSIDAFTEVSACSRMSVVIRATTTCTMDLDADGFVNFADLNEVLSFFGATGIPGLVRGDTEGDGVTNFDDLVAVLAYFGEAC